MSRNVRIAHGPPLVVSDVEYANIDWGNSRDDFVYFVTEDGGFVLVAWENTSNISVDGADPGPGSFPGYTITGGGIDNHISEATKDALEAELSAPGSQNKILSFVTSGGEEYHFAVANIQRLVIVPTTLVIEP